MTHRWAYMRLNCEVEFRGGNRTDSVFVDWLNEQGEQGWELVDVQTKAVSWPEPGVTVYRYYCLFKRRGSVADPMARVA